LPPPTPGGCRDDDISPDGDKLLMMKETSSVDAPREIRVVLNWFRELPHLVPTP
jgi:hypothetical protein